MAARDRVASNKASEPRIDVLCRQYEASSPEEAVRAAARELLERVEVTAAPVSLRALEEAVGIQGLRRESIGASGHLDVHGGRMSVRLRKEDAERRQNFSRAHEIAHALLLGIEGRSSQARSTKTRPSPPGPLEERLCNVVAAELLMPVRLVKHHAVTQKTSGTGLRRLADLFQTSCEAMARRLVELDTWLFAYVEWAPVRVQEPVFAPNLIVSSLPIKRALQTLTLGPRSCVGGAYIGISMTQGSESIRWRGRSRKLTFECWPSLFHGKVQAVRSVITPVTPFRKQDRISRLE